MRFRDLAIKNVKESWYQYAAYFFCCMLSVTIFYMFQSLIYHPGIEHGLENNIAMTGFLAGSQVLLVMFSFVFVLYSNATFIRSRRKEFGLFMTLGMTRGQLKRLVFYENTVIAVLAIVAGIFTGTLFSKLFFMAVSVILKLDEPISFAFVPQAVYWTAGGFFILFEVITLVTSVVVGRRSIIRLLKMRRWPRLSMFFSVVFTLVSLALIGRGYWLASTATVNTFGVRVFPILGWVVVGTYFLYRNASVVILRLLEKIKGFFYKRTNMLAVSMLTDKIKENATVLFNVTIVSAVILTAAGASYVAIQILNSQMYTTYPQTIGISAKGLSVKSVIDPDKVEKRLAKDGLTIKHKIEVTGLPAEVKNHKESFRVFVFVLPSRMYNRIAGKIGEEAVHVKSGEAVYVFPYQGINVGGIPIGKSSDLSVAEKKETLLVHREIQGSILNTISGVGNEMLIINDSQYEQLAKTLPDNQKITYVGYDIKNWRSAESTAEELQQSISENKRDHFTARTSQLASQDSANLALFVGVFISLLFFIAAGSIVYFRLFTDLPKDVAQLKALRRLGMTEGELSKVMTVQVFVIFFVPFLVATLHAVFAFNMMRVSMNVDVFQYTWIVIATFLVIQIIYYWITKKVYMRELFKR